MKKKQNFKLTPMFIAACSIILALVIIFVMVLVSIISYNIEVSNRPDFVGAWAWEHEFHWEYGESQIDSLLFLVTFNPDNTGTKGVTMFRSFVWSVVDESQNIIEIIYENIQNIERWSFEIINDNLVLMMIYPAQADRPLVHHRIS